MRSPAALRVDVRIGGTDSEVFVDCQQFRPTVLSAMQCGFTVSAAQEAAITVAHVERTVLCVDTGRTCGALRDFAS